MKEEFNKDTCFYKDIERRQGDGLENTKRRPGRPMKFPSVELLQEKIDEYFDMCDSHMKKILTKGGLVVDVSDPLPYTLSGLAVHLKCNRDTLLEYSHKAAFSGAIKSAKQRCEADSEQRLFTHFTPGVVFSLKNNYGWRDKIEIDAT